MMFPRTVLSCALALALSLPPARAADSPAAAGPAASPAASPAPTAAVASTTSTAVTATGLKVSATVRPEALAGFPVVVTLHVQNDTAATQSFPDLAARPHLVRFSIDGPRGRSERYNTPPAFDVATAWSLAPRSERNVLLEIPSSAGFNAGDYTIAVSVQDPGGTLQFAPVHLTVAVPRPVAGTPVWEPTIAQNLGTIFPWVHDRGTGGSGPGGLYLMQFDPRAQSRAMAQYWLADLPQRVDPQLSRARAGDSLARYVYWQVAGAATATFAYGRLDGPALRNGVRTASLPYPTAEVLDRGVTDGKGQLVLPLWIPAPGGKGGSLKAWTVNERGVQTLRSIVDLPARPAVHATAIDAGSNLLLGIAVAGGVDVYKVDGSLPIDLPARGTRHWSAQAGWTPTALAFDVLPDAGTRPGGLSMYLLAVDNPAKPTRYTAQWSDLGGNAFAPATGAWTLPAAPAALLTNGYGATYALAQDATGAWWYQPQGGSVAAVPIAKDARAPSLYLAGDVVRARVLGGSGVVTDTALGPKQP